MYRKTVLDNGVRVISERLDHFRSISLGIWVGAGSRDEVPDENGISHFIEHMIFKGTRSRTSLDIAKELDAIGGLSNAFTGTEYTCFHSRVLDKHFRPLAGILSDIFLHSTFDLQEMNRERQVILQEISSLEDTPDEHIHVLFNQFFFMNHPIGMPVLGTPQTVSAVKKEAILDYIKRFHTPERVVVAAAGNLEHEALVECFRPFFEGLQAEEIRQTRSAPEIHAGVLSHYKELEQVHICMGGKAPHLSGDHRFAAAILSTILGGNMSSRLFQEIREKRGLAYSVYTFLMPYMDTGMLGIYLGTEAKEVNRAVQVINREIRKVKAGEITDSDLAATREYLIGSIFLGAESTDARMTRLAKNEYVFGRYIPFDEVVQELERVRVDDVVAMAGEIFETGRVSLATLGPFEKGDLDISCLDFDGEN